MSLSRTKHLAAALALALAFAAIMAAAGTLAIYAAHLAHMAGRP